MRECHLKLAAGALILALGLSLTACSDKSSIIDPSVLSVSDAERHLTVYKSATCGCCSAWVSYLEEEGFSVTAIDHENMDSLKSELGLTNNELKSCHTAVIGDYLIEGHVPASDILRLITEKPVNIIGLTAPGMPLMSPGMSSRIPKDYAVLSFTGNGDSSIYSQY